MCYSEHRVAHAAEFVKRKQNVDSPIGLMTWVCQQPSLPELPRGKSKKYDSSAKACLGVQPISQQQWLCCSSKAE